MATSPQPQTELITVTEENFIRAESDMYFAESAKLAGGVGKWHHHREIMSIDKQTVIRANRDTLYSAAVFDLEAGPVRINLPDTAGRFMSLIAIDEDHYALETVYAPGSFIYTRDRVGTRYVLIGLRTFVDPTEPEDLERVHALQNAVTTDQRSVGTLELPRWDPVSQKQVREDLIKRAATLSDTRGMFGPRGRVDPERHLIGTATGWGGNAVEDALYLTGVPENNDGKTIHKLTIQGDVPVDGFWSISVYGADGYFVKNDQNCYSINSVTAHRDPDGSITIQFGGCNRSGANCIPIAPGWNYWTRLYRPRQEILDGIYTFPEPQPITHELEPSGFRAAASHAVDDAIAGGKRIADRGRQVVEHLASGTAEKVKAEPLRSVAKMFAIGFGVGALTAGCLLLLRRGIRRRVETPTPADYTAELSDVDLPES